MEECISKALFKLSPQIPGRNVIILLDTSASMYRNIDILKETVKQFVAELAKLKNSSFNILAFSTSNRSLFSELVCCSDANIEHAKRWISDLTCDTTTNTLAALASAFSDQHCDSVILFTDSLSNQKPSIVLKCVEELAQGRPCSTVYVDGGHKEEVVVNFLRTIALSTCGTSHVLSHFDNEIEYQQTFPPSKQVFTFCFKNCDNDYNKRPSLDEDKKEDSLVGKVVLARRCDNGYFYKGTIKRTCSVDSDILVSFLPSKKNPRYEVVKPSSVLFYDDINSKKIYKSDHVLASFGRSKKFHPGTVVDKQYTLDNDDSDSCSVTLEIKLYDGETKHVPLSSSCYIGKNMYVESVNCILQQTSTTEEFSRKQTVAYKCDLETDRWKLEEDSRRHDDSSGVMTEEELQRKIDRQLVESRRLLDSLNLYEDPDVRYLKSRYCDYDSGYQEEINSARRNYKEEQDQLFNKYYGQQKKRKDSLSSSSVSSLDNERKAKPIRSTPRRKKKSNTTSATPTPAWKTFGRSLSTSHTSSSNPPRRRSASVGSNVVERARKHWIGRPQNNDMSHLSSAKRFSKYPQADDYQTVDGTPMPRRTERKRMKPTNIIVQDNTHQPYGDFQHHDIISHRVVNYQAVYEPQPPDQQKTKAARPTKKEIKEKLRTQRLKSARESFEDKKCQDQKNENKNEKEKNERILKRHRGREEDGFTKIRIEIENDRQKWSEKQRQQNERVDREDEREDKNQERKQRRINARIEKKNAGVGTHAASVDGSSQTERSPSQKRLDFERQRVEKQIEAHQAKMDRLKSLRKRTDVRFDKMRQENDNARDMVNHVKENNLQNYRAGILP